VKKFEIDEKLFNVPNEIYSVQKHTDQAYCIYSIYFSFVYAVLLPQVPREE